jgi:hypothetical protein
MRVRFPAAAALAILILAIAIPVAADSKDSEKKPEKVGKVWKDHWDIAGRPSVHIRTGDANVTIHTKDGAGVSVEVKELGSQKGLFVGDRDPEVEFARRGQEIEISAVMRGIVGGIVFSDYKLDVQVWVPRQSDLDIRTKDGDVTLGPLAGRIGVNTSDGDISALGLRGEITMASSDGDIEAGDLDGKLRLRTSDGDGSVAGRFDMLAVRSSDGDLDVTAIKGSALVEPWSLESSDGRIGLRVPADLKATLDARSRDGALDVDLPVQIQGRIHRNRLQGDLNGGGPLLTLRSSDGAIRISALR